MESIGIMTYNICGYNKDQGPKGFPVAIRDEKVSNLKRLLMTYAPDFVGLQEDYKYIDTDGSEQARKAIFSPVWGFVNGTTETTLRAKYGAVPGSYALKRFSTDRFYAKAVFNYTPTDQRILFVSCHPSAYVKNEDKRRTEYTELFEMIQKESWDHCIVAGDFNTNTDNDRDLLRKLCIENRFDMALGTFMPRLPTCLGYDGSALYSFDNILVSGGLMIRKTMVLKDWYNCLYSDHVPVFCEVVL